MAFLEALGRSKAVSGTLGDIEAIKTSRLNRQLAIAGEERKARVFDFQMKQLQEEETRLNSVYDVSTDPRFLALPTQDDRKEFLTWGASQGWWDESGKGTVRSAQNAMKTIESSSKQFDYWSTKIVEGRKQAYEETLGALNEELAKPAPNEKTVQALRTKAGGQLNLYQMSLNSKNVALQQIGAAKASGSEYSKFLQDRGLSDGPGARQEFLKYQGELAQVKSSGRGTLTPTQALDKIAKAESAIVRLKNKGGLTDDEIFKFGIAGTDIGDVIKKGDTSAAEQALRDYIENLRQFVPSDQSQSEIDKTENEIFTDASPEVRSTFNSNKEMSDKMLGQWSREKGGFEVYDKSGKLVGFWRP